MMIFSGAVLMAGIILIAKTSFLFDDTDTILLNETVAKSNISYDWRTEYQNVINLWFDPRCKFKNLKKSYFENYYAMPLKRAFMMTTVLFSQQIAPIPTEDEPNYCYLIGAIIALSCAGLTAALLIISKKVKTVENLMLRQ